MKPRTWRDAVLVYAAWSRKPKGIPRVELAHAEHFMASQPDRLHFTVLDGLGRHGIVSTRRAAAFARVIVRYWEDEFASTAAYWRVALHASWIHLVLMPRPRGEGSWSRPTWEEHFTVVEEALHKL